MPINEVPINGIYGVPNFERPEVYINYTNRDERDQPLIVPTTEKKPTLDEYEERRIIFLIACKMFEKKTI